MQPLLASVLGLFLLFTTDTALSQAEPPAVDASPLLVVFGPEAEISEGDHDWKQVIRFSVPADAGTIYLRVFDPDIGGSNDEFVIGYGTETRYGVYGGSSTAKLSRDEEGNIVETVEGEPLETVIFGADRSTDNQWKTLFQLEADQGTENGDRREFFMLVDGVVGKDGNVFDVAVSTAEDRNSPVDGLRLYSYVPTFQVAERGMLTELRFTIPETAKDLAFENFDSAGGRIAYDGLFRSWPLTASPKSEWRRTEVRVHDDETGRLGSVIVEGGRESPNDVTLFVEYNEEEGKPADKPLAIDLPVRGFRPNGRPVIVKQIAQNACGEMQFDATASIDPENTPLTYRWIFDDGEETAGSFTRKFEKTGDYSGRLEVFDGSGLVASGRSTGFNFYVKPKPVARFSASTLAAQNTVVQLDGTASSTLARPSGNRIHRYIWRMGDGTVITQEEGDEDFGQPAHVYRDHGDFTIELTVEDSAENPCNSDTVSQSITINAPPVAEAGSDQRIAYGTFATFDAGAVTGVDGDEHQFTWDFGDGQSATGAQVEHKYAESGTYNVTLTVDDKKGATNSVSSDSMTIFVNAAPVARDVAIPDTLVLGAAGVFDASKVLDIDGEIRSIEWRFSDGNVRTKPAFRRSFEQPGPFEVSLIITDDSGLPNDTTTVTRTINVIDPDNQPPVSVIVAVDQAKVGEPVIFDASNSEDPDGSILAYRWDFGDGTGGERVETPHVYHKPGTYTVRLDVTDNSGKDNQTATAEMQIVVAYAENQTPIVSVGQDRSAFVNEVLEFDATGTIDPDGNIVA